MCLWCYASSPVQHQGLLKDKWLLIKHILCPHLSCFLLSVPPVSVSLLPVALPPPAEARLPGRGAVGLASSTLRLITPLILGLPVCLQGGNSGLYPPTSFFAPTPTSPLYLCLPSPSSSSPFIPLSLCCQRHWGMTLSHSSRQGHFLAEPALFAICHGKWGSCGLCRGQREDQGLRVGGCTNRAVGMKGTSPFSFDGMIFRNYGYEKM